MSTRVFENYETQPGSECACAGQNVSKSVHRKDEQASQRLIERHRCAIKCGRDHKANEKDRESIKR